MSARSFVVVGGGPAGLTAALQLARHGAPVTVEGTDFISSMPVTEFVRRLDPPPPPEVLEAARGLRYRDLLTVCLIVDRPHLFPDNWIYVHDAGVKVARIQNFKNWSPEMVPDASKTSLGLEYFCQEGDAFWSLPDAEIIARGRSELERIGLARAEDVEDGCVFRVARRGARTAVPRARRRGRRAARGGRPRWPHA